MDPAQELELKVTSYQKAMNSVIDRFESPVQQFYCGATVFVTGGSGFLGKQLVEKLFRSAKIAKLYMLIRTKKGKSIEKRLAEILEDPVFHKLREKQPNISDRIVPVEGDVADIRLGINDKDWSIITKEVDIIFHGAATTRFDEQLRVSTLINIRGTREALLLGRSCEKLRCFIHISTAYSHAREDLIDKDILDDFYKSPVDPEAIIGLVESTDEHRLNEVTLALIKNWPNTYTFAKAVAEELVKNMSSTMPICIVRPAIVVPAYREPSPGWTDMSNVFGTSGVVLGVGLGLLHIVYGKASIMLSLIPVDYVNNATVCAGWETAKRWSAGDTETRIYPVTSARNPVKWGSVRDYAMTEATKYPSPKAVWHVFAFVSSNKYIYTLLFSILHIIPAYIVDGICLLLGKERRIVKLTKKMFKMSIVLGYFALNQWHFVDTNLEKLYNDLDPLDKDIYNFDVKTIDWKEYVCVWCIGLRKYIVKDGINNTKAGLKKQKYLAIIHYIVFPIYLYCLYKIISTGFAVINIVLSMIFYFFK